MGVHAPVGAYERQLLIERSKITDMHELRSFDEKEYLDVALWECAHTDGVSAAGERCNLTVERNGNDEIVVPNACSDCALATFKILRQRQAPIQQAKEDAQNFGKMLDERSRA